MCPVNLVKSTYYAYAVVCLVSPLEVMMDADEDESHDLPRCEEHLSSSPGFPTSDSYMEYGT